MSAERGSFRNQVAEARRAAKIADEQHRESAEAADARNQQTIKDSAQYKEVLAVLVSPDFVEVMEEIWDTYASESVIPALRANKMASRPDFRITRLEEYVSIVDTLKIKLQIQLRHPDHVGVTAKATYLRVAIKLDIFKKTIAARWGLPIYDLQDQDRLDFKERDFDSYEDLREFLLNHLVAHKHLGLRGEFHDDL